MINHMILHINDFSYIDLQKLLFCRRTVLQTKIRKSSNHHVYRRHSIQVLKPCSEQEKCLRRSRSVCSQNIFCGCNHRPSRLPQSVDSKNKNTVSRQKKAGRGLACLRGTLVCLTLQSWCPFQFFISLNKDIPGAKTTIFSVRSAAILVSWCERIRGEYKIPVSRGGGVNSVENGGQCTYITSTSSQSSIFPWDRALFLIWRPRPISIHHGSGCSHRWISQV